MNNYLIYGKSDAAIKSDYPNVQLPFKSAPIVTQLPKRIALTRAVAIVAFSSYVAFNTVATVFCWPVVAAGATYAGWTIYSNLIRKDPLIAAFHTICGGKDKFDQLPEIGLDLNGGKPILKGICQISWEQFKEPIYKAKALDGRIIVVVQGKKHAEPSSNEITNTQFVFVEKIGPGDKYTHQDPLYRIALLLLVSPFFSKTAFLSDYSFASCSFNSKIEVNDKYLCPSLAGKMANEFYAQIGANKTQAKEKID